SGGRRKGFDCKDKRDMANVGEGRDVGDEIELEILVEGGFYRVRRRGTEERVAIRGRVHDRLGRDSARGARPVLDDDLLTEPLRQPLTHQAGGDVRPTTGRKADDPVHWTCRIALSPSDPRHRRQRGSASGQMQKISAGKFHFGPPSHHSITSSARASKVGGMAIPTALAVLRLMISSNLVGCAIGRSPGFSPFSTRPV